jgi:hypothetical protein
MSGHGTRDLPRQVHPKLFIRSFIFHNYHLPIFTFHFEASFVLFVQLVKALCKARRETNLHVCIAPVNHFIGRTPLRSYDCMPSLVFHSDTPPCQHRYQALSVL